MEITPTTVNWAEWVQATHEQAAVQRARALAEPLSLAARKGTVLYPGNRKSPVVPARP